MHPFFRDYLDWLDRLHGELKRALEATPAAALDWSPEPDVNSLAVLVAHVAGAERYWAADMLRGQTGRVRESEFATVGVPAGELAARLDAALAEVREAVEGLELDDLKRELASPRDGKTFTLGYCLLHALEHTALHAGHAQIMVQLLDSEG